jgi:hypothetical protein
VRGLWLHVRRVRQGTASSGLKQCVDDLKDLEATSRKAAKANKRDGLPAFENGHWQEVLGRFVAFQSLEDDVRPGRGRRGWGHGLSTGGVWVKGGGPAPCTVCLWDWD